MSYSKKEIANKSSGSGSSFAFIIGSIAAWCTNPTFVGWAGVGKSLLTGIGTSIGASIVGWVGFLGGFVGGSIVGGILGSVIGRGRRGAMIGGTVVGCAGAICGAGAGGLVGYTTVESWLLAKDKANAKTVVFNDRAAKTVAHDAKTFVLDAKAFIKHELKLP